MAKLIDLVRICPPPRTKESPSPSTEAVALQINTLAAADL